MSLTTWIFLDVAFWLRVPVAVHSLRLPVSKSALKRILAEAEPIAHSRQADRVNVFDDTWMAPMGNVPAPSVSDQLPALSRRVSRNGCRLHLRLFPGTVHHFRGRQVETQYRIERSI